MPSFTAISFLPASGERALSRARAAPGARRAAVSTPLARTGGCGPSLGARACIQERIGSTSFYKAEQVKYTLRLSSHTALEPAIVLGGEGSNVKVKMHCNGAEVSVGPQQLAKLGEAFAPGDAVKRAMLNGQEEDATVVGVDSEAWVTIRILPNGPTYSSDVKRLRKAVPSDGVPMPAAPASTAVDVAALERAFAAKFASVARSVRRNPNAEPGTPLHARFAAAAAAAAGSKVIDVMLHGTPEGNIDSILQTSLRGRPSCGTCWFTDDHSTASTFARNAKRMIAFAVLRDKGDRNPIATTRDQAHHLPLFELERSV